MTNEEQKEPNALDALGCYEDILVEALKDVDFLDAMALIDKAIPHNNTIRTALTVLQKIASGDDWFDISSFDYLSTNDCRFKLRGELKSIGYWEHGDGEF